MSYNTIIYDIRDTILTITLNRPENLNAVTVELTHELSHAFERASEDDAVAAIVVTGAGRAFCAGMDLNTGIDNVFGLDQSQQPTMQDMHERLEDESIKKGVRDLGGIVNLAIYNCKKPVIGAINGPAVGFGATMQLPMDIRLASETARFGYVFGKLGVVMEACSSWFLPRLVGMQQALEWAYSAEIFDAETAKSAGLVKEVYPPDELLPAAYALAHKFTKNRSPVATALMRQMLYRNSAQASPLAANQVDSLGMFYTSQQDGEEGVQAFLEKREPRFSSKASAMPDFYPWWE